MTANLNLSKLGETKTGGQHVQLAKRILSNRAPQGGRKPRGKMGPYPCPRTRLPLKRPAQIWDRFKKATKVQGTKTLTSRRVNKGWESRCKQEFVSPLPERGGRQISPYGGLSPLKIGTT